MRKLISVLLCLATVLCMSTAVFAADAQGNYGSGTDVKIKGVQGESYTVTVPATISVNVGQTASGQVTVSGTWASNRMVKVTADSEVSLTNSITGSDEKILDITFVGIEKCGSNVSAIKATDTGAYATITLESISNALFGTWSGHFDYEVSIEDVLPPAGAYFGSDYLTWSELKTGKDSAEYDYDSQAIGDTSLGSDAFKNASELTKIDLPVNLQSIGSQAFYSCSKLASIELPDSLTSIGSSAFYLADKLASVTYKGVTYTKKSELINALKSGGVSVGEEAFDETTIGYN